MKGILLLNGLPYGGEIVSKNAYVVCCDGAYLWARDKVKIDENIGDFDSLNVTPVPPPKKIYPAEKDFTDGEIGLERLIERGCDEVVIYGGFGKRSDHFIGNLHLLYKAYKRGVSARLIGEDEEAFVLGGKIALGAYKNKTLSVLPFGSPLHIIDSAGLKYSYPEVIGYGECRGISNVVLSSGAFVEIKEDERALIIVNRGEV